MAHSRNTETSSYSDSAVCKHLVLLLTAVASPSTGAIFSLLNYMLYFGPRLVIPHPAALTPHLSPLCPFLVILAFLVRSCYAFF